ncbi:MAG TPA: cytochrome P450 [Anaerolineae bacterium]|nr:cytochrome P450 [Anaerolineae bacterium]
MATTPQECPVDHTAIPTQTNIDQLPTPPGSAGLPFIGETLAFVANPRRFIRQRQAKYGDIFYSNILGRNTIYILNPDANGWIFSGEGDYLQNQWTTNVQQLLGDQCVTLLNGDEHKTRRAQLMPHFRHSVMRNFSPTIYNIAHRYFTDWTHYRQPITIFAEMQHLIFEIAITLIMGNNNNINIPYLSQLFRTWLAGLFALPINLPFTAFGKSLVAKEELLAIIEELVIERQQLDEQPNDILGSLINIRDENGQPLSTTAIVHEIQLLFFAGHDTTYNALSNLMLNLSQNPKVLARGRAEIKEANLTTPYTLDDLKNLPYLNQIINEGLRHTPPVAGAFRVMLRDQAYAGYRLPKDWVISLSIIGTHTDDSVWTAPDQFDPDRWSNERQEQKNHQHNYIPFGGGPRVCLGQNFALTELRVILALLLDQYHWTPASNQDLTMSLIPLPRPKSGFKVTFTRYAVSSPH